MKTPNDSFIMQSRFDSRLLESARQILALAGNGQAESSFEFDGQLYRVGKGVFSPAFFKSSSLLTYFLPYPIGGRFLEIGCGCGLTTIYSIKCGVEYALGIDINKAAVLCSRNNAKRLQVDADFRFGDVFSSLSESDGVFDLVYWNLPFIHVDSSYEPKNIIELSLLDPGLRAFKCFLKGVREWIAEQGRVFVAFSEEEGSIRFNRLLDEYAMYGILIKNWPGVVDENPVTLQLYEVKW